MGRRGATGCGGGGGRAEKDVYLYCMNGQGGRLIDIYILGVGVLAAAVPRIAGPLICLPPPTAGRSGEWTELRLQGRLTHPQPWRPLPGFFIHTHTHITCTYVKGKRVWWIHSFFLIQDFQQQIFFS